jgi:hypothetical protein
MKITKRQLRKIIKEEKAKLNEAQMGDGTLEGWAMQDDAVDAVGDGSYEMYTDDHGGQEELNFIIERLREVYALGGGVSMIKIEDISPQGGPRQ